MLSHFRSSPCGAPEHPKDSNVPLKCRSVRSTARITIEYTYRVKNKTPNYQNSHLGFKCWESVWRPLLSVNESCRTALFCSAHCSDTAWTCADYLFENTHTHTQRLVACCWACSFCMHASEKDTLFKLIIIYLFIYQTDLQTRFQKSWDTVQIVNKKGMQ